MIIYGWRASHVKSEMSDTIICGDCKTSKSTLFSVFSRYFHIFWIPLIPYGMKGASRCQSCGLELTSSEMADDYKRAYKELKQQTKVPFWQFAGVIIISLLIAYFAYTNNQQEQSNAKFLSEPSIGDVYYYKSESGNYTSFILKEISDDSVSILHNDYESTRRTQIDDIDIKENYTDIFYRLSRDELKQMNDADEIIKILRD